MARTPAIVTKVAFRTAERGDGAEAGSASSKPSVIDLANNRLRLSFISPARLRH